MIIAIDPGKSGGIAFESETGKVLSFSMPETDGDVVSLFDDIPEAYCLPQEQITVVIEKVGGFAGTGQPGSAMFKFGENCGFIRGVVMSHRWRVEMVTPQAWMKALSLGTKSGMSKTDWKNKLKGEAQRLFPDQKVTLKTSDALLILEYARRKL